MNQGLMLHFQSGGEMNDLKVELTGTEVSPHTGRPLRYAESIIQVAEDRAGDFRDALEGSPATDDSGHVWTGRISSESYSSEGGPYQMTIEWSEHEDVQAERVRFAGLELTPSSYEERIDDDDLLVLEFQATLSPEETNRLRELQTGTADEPERYWPVVRVGVSEEERRMRLGRVLWSRRDDGNIEHKIVLVADEQAEPGISPWAKIGQPQLGHTMGGLADMAGQFDALLETLERGGVLDAEAIQTIREAGRDARRTRVHTFYEVADVSEW